MFIDEEKPSLIQGVQKLNLRVAEIGKIFEEKSSQKIIVEDMVVSTARYMERKCLLILASI
jgi:hypothetical protein